MVTEVCFSFKNITNIVFSLYVWFVLHFNTQIPLTNNKNQKIKLKEQFKSPF